MGCILGIETTCDDTGVAIYGADAPLFEWLFNQRDALNLGGVVPELAARQHAEQLPQALAAALKLYGADIQAFAYSAGPGLLGPIKVGALWTQMLAWHYQRPLLPLDHLEAHIFSAFIGEKLELIPFPFLALLVSGGHTLLWIIRGLGREHYQLLGTTRDDAAGEALDKVARWMGLGYPGGPKLEQYARLANSGKGTASPTIHKKSQGFDFSFSGLKSHFRRRWSQMEPSPESRAQLAFEVQEAVLGRLITPCRHALREHGLKNLVFVGGVSANQAFQEALRNLAQEEGGGFRLPERKYAGDNGTMVAYLGSLYLSSQHPPFREPLKPLRVYSSTQRPWLAQPCFN